MKSLIAFIAFIITGFLATKILSYFLEGIIKKLVIDSNTKIDDIIYNSLRLPLLLIVFLIFLYIGILLAPIQIDINFVNNVFKFVSILVGTYAIVNFVDGIFEYYIIPWAEKTETKLDEHLIKPLRKLIRLLIIVFGLLTALSSVGYDITTILAGLGIGGLAFALAMQDTIKNFIAGVLILIDKPFTIGDWIRVGDLEGIIEEVGIRSTRIRTFDQSLITVANSYLLERPIENFSERTKRRVLINIGITYETPVEKIEKAKQIIKEILSSNPMVVGPIRVHFYSFGDWSLNIRVEYYVKNTNFDEFLDTVDYINKEIKRRFDLEGIEFAYPTYTIYQK
ncbi:NEQ198 [Nanoarchaeum equitans Kin4-M]|uniref:NEQ198 n=1 Tax=Nanoarchaeum equitans (strain Kin4-M) TaxID=228908 RepID=Q74MQ0_NANEQ|nr:NEQ198 [Nanoarchaeum equitans Kin4-M]